MENCEDFVDYKENGPKSVENDSKVVDNDVILITPPARENTEVELDIEVDNNKESETVNVQISSEETVVSREIIVDIPDAGETVDDSDPDKVDMLAAMEKAVEFNELVTFNDDNNDVDDELMAISRQYNYDGELRARSRGTYPIASRRNINWDREDTIRPLPEFTYSWESTVNCLQCKTGFRRIPSNQFPRHSVATGPQTRAWSSRSKSRNTQHTDESLENEIIPIPCGKKLFNLDTTCNVYTQTDKSSDKSSCVTDRSDLTSSRNASRLALESREAMFRRAMTLLSARCTSVRQTSELEGDKLSLGGQVPKYFYVTQDKPLPMEPLKAWRGYHGNIYFEPININPLQSDLNSARAQTSVPRQNTEPALRTRTSVPKVRASIDKENRPIQESRSESRQTNKSSGSLRSSNRHMVYLDKQSVLNRLNDNIHEDIVWLEGTENTGSLAVRPKTFQERPTREKERDLQYNKERIRKGSVAHKLFIENRSKQKPRLSVNGDKFTPPHSLSPLLRTQTQYSLSSQRLTTNSPDPYHLNDSKLPPIDQIRVSLKHMDSRRDSGGQQRSKVPYNRPVTITDDMKPFVKYSPDVVAKMSQPTNIC